MQNKVELTGDFPQYNFIKELTAQLTVNSITHYSTDCQADCPQYNIIIEQTAQLTANSTTS